MSVPALRIADEPDLHLDRDPDMGTPRFVRRRSGFLTPAMPGATPTEAASAFIEANGKTFTLHPTDILPPNARVTRDVTTRHNGMRSLTWQQQKDGIDIYGAVFMLNLTAGNRIINVSSKALHMPCVRFHDVVEVTADEAVRIAAEYFNAQRPTLNIQRPTEAIWYPLDMIGVVKAWDLIVESPNLESHRLLIRADTGEVVEDMNLTWSAAEPAAFNIYTNDSPKPMTPGPDAPTNFVPVEVPRTIVTLSALDTNASPDGWVTAGQNALVGNNANVYADWDDNDAPDGPAVTGTTYRVFDLPFDLSVNPVTYVDFSQAQAFYAANMFHDRLWLLGFDEPAGNFQSSNFGRGGVGGDALVVEVQNDENAGGLHGIAASYQGWGDGSQGKVSVSTSSSPTRRDGALDSELLFHEMTHGLSSRLIGNGFGLTTTQSRGLAEGWSDFLPLALLGEPGDASGGCYPFATYTQVANKWGTDPYYGIRRFPYSSDTNKAPQTVADTDPNQIDFPPGIPRNPDFGSAEADQIHNIGEVWCLMLWECRANLIEEQGFAGNGTMLQLVVDGMKLSPVNPTFIEARDAVLQADLVNNAGFNQIALWKGFAKRGLGYEAWVPGSVSTVGIKEDHDLPFGISPVMTESAGDGDGYIEPGESAELTVTLHSYEMALTSITALLSGLSSNVTVTASNALLPAIDIGGTSTSAPSFMFTVNAGFPGNTDAEFTLRVHTDQGWFEQPIGLRIGNPYDYPPEITDIAVVELSETDASIAWHTGIPADGLVEYGLSTNYGLATALDPVMRTNHLMEVSGLAKGTEYHYRVVCEGTNGLTAYSVDQTFRTRERVYVYAGSTATQELGTVEAPFRSLQAAAEAAKEYGDDILVATGTYTSAQTEAVLDLDGSEYDLAMEGGYNPDFAWRDPGPFVTTIDGQRARRGISLDNGAKLTISGVAITRGQGAWGGGVHVRKSEFDATECVIVDNSSTNGVNDLGGGVYGTLGSHVDIESCTLAGNSADFGGGVFVVSSGTHLRMLNTTVSDNLGFLTSGGVELLVGASAYVSNCSLVLNNGTHVGGGMSVFPYCEAVVQSTTVASNRALSGTDPYSDGGGGIAVAGSASTATLTMHNVLLWGNMSPYGADLRCASKSEVHAIHCNIGDIYGTLDTSNNVISVDPMFANPEAGDFHLLYGSPCIDAGMTNYGGGTVDMDGEARPFGAAIDIGADEFVDVDDDHMADYWEDDTFGGITNSDGTADVDEDELDDFGEYMNQTDPHDPDTDVDGMWDGWEVGYMLNPLFNDAGLDPDLDTMLNLGEFTADTNPHDSNSLLRILRMGTRWGLPWLQWKGGEQAWQSVEMNADLRESNGWLTVHTHAPPTPVTNATMLFGHTNWPVFYRVRAHR